MESVRFAPLTEPTDMIAAAITRWENDPALIPLTRPNRSREDLDKRQTLTRDELGHRLQSQHMYLILLDDEPVGEMSYQVDPGRLLKHEPGTAWIGITIGEASARGKGIGRQALHYLEQQIALHGLRRIELGVFAFNIRAYTLYQHLGYREIGRIDDFTYWDGRLWQDIRMEKYLHGAARQA